MIGAGIGAWVLFLFGTSVGRHFLKNILEVTENIEANLVDILQDLDSEDKIAQEASGPKTTLGKVTTILSEIEDTLTR